MAELILAEARQAISQQQGVLDALRSRSATLFAAAAVTTSFLGGPALDDGRLTYAGWSGAAAFVLLTLAMLYVLWPRAGWTFRLAARDLLVRYRSGEKQWTLPDVQTDLANWWETYFDANEKELNKLFYAYQTAVVLLIAVVLLFLLELALQGVSGG